VREWLLMALSTNLSELVEPQLALCVFVACVFCSTLLMG
jgi:hypothetical protein